MKSKVPQKSNQPLIIAVIVLGMLCFLFIIATMINVNEKNRVGALLDERIAEINELKEEHRDVKLDVVQLNQRLMQAQTRARAAGDPLPHLDGQTEPTLSPQQYRAKLAYLEKELNAAEQQAELYFSKLSPDQREQLAIDGDSTVRQIILSRSADEQEIIVEFKIDNNTPREMAAVLGVIRFWQNSRIMLEEPFRVSNIPPNGTKPFHTILPIQDFDRYSVLITGMAAGASKAPVR